MSDELKVNDNIEHPAHYTQGIETVDYITAWDMNYIEGNIIKYVTRYKYKGGLEDLKKARWYLNRLIDDLQLEKDIGEIREKPWVAPSPDQIDAYIYSLNQLHVSATESYDEGVTNPSSGSYEWNPTECEVCGDAYFCDGPTAHPEVWNDKRVEELLEEDDWVDSHIPLGIDGKPWVDLDVGPNAGHRDAPFNVTVTGCDVPVTLTDVTNDYWTSKYVNGAICDDPCSRPVCIKCVNMIETQVTPLPPLDEFPRGWPYDSNAEPNTCLTHECICPDKGGCK